jgi:gallate decarboxylase subunit D
MPQDDTTTSGLAVHESYGTGCHRVEASALRCGNDLVVALQGGTRHHIGATAMAVARPSLADPSMVSSSASVLCVVGHKEDELARGIALRVSAALACTVTVVAGLHVDDATGGDIRLLLENCDHAIERLRVRLVSLPDRAAHGRDVQPPADRMHRSSVTSARGIGLCHSRGAGRRKPLGISVTRCDRITGSPPPNPQAR